MTAWTAELNAEQQHTVARIGRRLAGMKRLLFVTGAGMSADSGLPTYRGVGGLYDGAVTDDGIPIEEALSGGMMVRDPARCWRHIMQIEQACRGAQPNAGHVAIRGLEQQFEVWILTQNVDGLHRAAGSGSVIDIHGDVRDLMCTSCEHQERVRDYEGFACPPLCPRCQAVLRPDVVLFGEALPFAKVGVLSQQLAQGFDAVFSVGTTSVFPYIVEPVLRTRMSGGLTVEINPGRTSVSDLVDEKLDCRAAPALEALAKQL